MNLSTVLWMSTGQLRSTAAAAMCQSYLYGLNQINIICKYSLSSSSSSLSQSGLRQLNRRRTSPINTLVNNNSILLLLTGNSNKYYSTTTTSAAASAATSGTVYGAEKVIANVKKAIMFTRSFDKNILDGIVTHVTGKDHLIIDFGKFMWFCAIPTGNKIKYRVGSHVRATKIDAIDSVKVSRSSILVLKETKVDEQHLKGLSFPWKVTRIEKYFLYILVTTIIAIIMFNSVVIMIVSTVMNTVKPGIR